MIVKNNLEENTKVLFGNEIGVVQVIYQDRAYVRFRDGVIRVFELNGAYIKDY